ncbi:MAG: hypothetical protein ACI9XR_000003 [Flavobacterium sp.]|jgi:hypothetical protein
MKIKIGLIFLLIALTGSFIYFYAYKNHRDISSEEAQYTIKISDLQVDFTKNESLANSKYQDKTIQVSGKITSIEKESRGIVLDDKLFGTFKDSIPNNLVKENLVTIKGRFIGYDDLLEEFKVDQIIIVK